MSKTTYIKSILILVMIVMIGGNSFSQKSKTQQLKAKEEMLKKQLSQTQELLNATRSSQQTTLSELRIINKQIAYKEELLMNMKSQIRETERQINKNKEEIKVLEEDLARLKKEFVEMVRFAYKNRKKEYNAMYLFSSDSYSQAYRRMKYIEQYTANRTRKAKEITLMQEDLNEQNLVLVANIESKKELVASFDKEKQQFLEVKKEQQEILTKIKANKESLQQKLAEQKAEQERIAVAIRAEIEKELARANKNNVFQLSPEAKLASSSFEKNRGSLPWPVARGTITKRFGKQRHSQVATAYVQNNGIDISTLKGANVRVVFDGTVTSIFTIPGSGQTVIVSHGAYRTVYSNLKIVEVKLNQKLKTKQTLGSLLPDNSGSISESHFEIWKISSSGMNPQNPAIWLYRN
ncbi:MAG: peptidoglycan DD-metalloendopeptidase family protein [Flavobacteriales bacterium]|jgi:murein hydrolase activator